MAKYNSKAHDCGLLRTDGSTKVGLTLLRDKDGVAWDEGDDETLAQAFYTGAPDFSYRPPQKEIRFIKSSWRAGFGLKYEDTSAPERYYSSINCDARFKGNIIAGPLGTTVTKPSTPSDPSITDGNLELWDDASNMTNWTETGSATLTRNGTNQREGTFCANFIGAAAGTVYQDIDSTNDFAGVEVVYTQYVWSDGANVGRIGISDGVTTTYSSYVANDQTWAQLTVTKTLSVATDKIRLILDWVGSGGFTARYDGAATFAVTTITVGASLAYADFNALHYKSFGAVLAKQNSGGTGYDLVATMPAAITDMEVFLESSGTEYLYLALGDATDLVRMTTGEVFTSSGNNEQAYFLTSTGSTLFGVKQAGGNKLRKTTAVDTWSDVTLVGHSYDNQTDLLTDAANTVIVCKEEMPYYIDGSSNDQPYLPEAATSRSSTSGKNSHRAFGKVYTQFGDQLLYEFDGTAGSATAVKTNISPSTFMTGLSDFSGKIQAITDDGTYLIVVLDNSTKIEVLMGQWEAVGGVIDFRWHPVAEITLTGCETATVSNHVKKRLWITSTASGDNVYYFPVTTKYGDIENDSDYKYQQSGEFIDSWLHGNLRGDDKAHYSIEATLGHPYDADIYFEVHYKKWEDTSFTDIGDLKGTSSDRTHTLFIPDDASSNHPVSPFFQVKFIPKTDDTAKSPKLESYDITGAWRPSKRKLISAIFVSDEEILLQDGRTGKDTIADTKAALDEANDATWPVTFYDIDGATITVNFLEMRPDVIEIEGVSSQKKRIKRIYRTLMQKITLS